MSLTAFLAGNALLAVILLAWNLHSIATLRMRADDNLVRWPVAVGLLWRFGAVTAALAALAVAMIDGVLYGESGDIPPVASIYSIGAVSVAVGHAIVSVLLYAEAMGRSSDFASTVFTDDSPWRRPIEWATVVIVPAGLLAALIVGLVVQVVD